MFSGKAWIPARLCLKKEKGMKALHSSNNLPPRRRIPLPLFSGGAFFHTAYMAGYD
jgi:hypothetical protein